MFKLLKPALNVIFVIQIRDFRVKMIVIVIMPVPPVVIGIEIQMKPRTLFVAHAQNSAWTRLVMPRKSDHHSKTTSWAREASLPQPLHRYDFSHVSMDIPMEIPMEILNDDDYSAGSRCQETVQTSK
ncbi:hypothetical protein ACOMHN_060258 [Nucella lapillus]